MLILHIENEIREEKYRLNFKLIFPFPPMDIPSNLKYEYEIMVTEEYVARGIGLDVQVFSTPSLVLCMETAAYKAVEKYIPEGFTTVGTGICIRHIKATPIGDKVRCVATLVKREGNKLEFEVEAYDSEGKIGEGRHWRYIIDIEKFQKGLRRKKI